MYASKVNGQLGGGYLPLNPPPPQVSFPLPFIIQVVSFNVSVKCLLSPIKRVHVRFGFSSYSSIFHYFHTSLLGEEDINTLCDFGMSNHVSIKEYKFMKQL